MCSKWRKYLIKDIKTTKKTDDSAIYKLRVGSFSSLPTADFFEITTWHNVEEKIVTPLNYVGYSLAPVSACFAGFLAYSICDYIKVMKEENQDW